MYLQDPPEKLPEPIAEYLSELERAIKQEVGVVPEDALADAREYLTRDYQALAASEPGLKASELHDHFVSTLGPPTSVAKAYASVSTPTREKAGNAPGWRICCTKCGRSAPASRIGITRLGARSLHKYVVGYCRDCGWIRWLRLERDLQRNNLTQALGITAMPAELRRHRPWRTLISIAAVVIATYLLVAWMVGAWPGAHATATATQLDATFSNLPTGWRIDKNIVVDQATLPAFSQKLGGQIKYLSNTFLSDGQRSLQVNVIRAVDHGAADSVYQTMQRIKRDPRSVVKRDATIFEFIMADKQQARFAAEARYRLPIQPEQVTYQVRFQATPVVTVDDMSWNKLFNLLVAVDGPQPPAEILDQIALLSAQFQLGSSLQLARTGIGQAETQWEFKPAPQHNQPAQADNAFLFEFSNLPTKAGLPVVTVSGQVTCESLATSPARREDTPGNYLAPTSAWPVDDQRITQLADAICRASAADQKKLAALLAWFGEDENMRFRGQTGSRYGDRQVLHQRYGHCWDYADLFVTLARASGLPARQVLGWLFPGEGHVWCEVLVDGRWRHVDPTTGTGCGSDYIPLTITTDGEVTFVYASTVEITPQGSPE